LTNKYNYEVLFLQGVMKKYKTFLILAYILFVMGIGIGVASAAEDWFANPNTVYETSVLATPYAISVDCVPDGSQCLAAVYAETTLSGNGVFLYSSTDSFQTPTPFPIEIIVKDYSGLITKMVDWDEDKIQLPLAVKYNPNDGLYYIMTDDTIYSLDLVDLDVISSSGLRKRYVSLVNGNEPYVVQIWSDVDSGNTDDGIDIISLYNGSIVVDDLVVNGAFASVKHLDSAYGFFLASSAPAGSPYKYQYRWFDDIFQKKQGGYLTDDIYNYLTNTKYLRYLANISSVFGVYRRKTDDFSLYSSTEIEYSYNPNENNITGYEVKELDKSNIYSYINRTVGSNTAYFYEQNFYDTFISGSYYDVQSEYYKTNINISGQLECFNTTYSDSLSSFLTIEHPCKNYNLTILSSTLHRPVSFRVNTSVQDGCNDYLIYVRFIEEYGYTITVFDDVTQLPLPNANVQFGSQSGTTDENGEVSFSILPLTNITMKKTDTDQCEEEYVASASATVSYPLTITKSGYTTYFQPAIEPAEFVGDEIEYEDEVQINMRPVGGNVIVRLRDKNGRRIENTQLSSVTSVDANGIVYVVDDTGQTYIGNSTGGVPVNFFITSNATSFNVTVNFTYINYTDSKIVEVEQDETTVVYFRLNESKTEMFCESNFDCVDDFCLGNYFYQLSGCIQGECVYQTPQLCSGGCDEDVGCYERKLTTTCDSRYDCYSNCSSNYVSYTGLCASDGYCVQIRDVCETQCVNETTSEVYNYGCSPSTGRCCDSDLCYDAGRSRYLFQLDYEYITGIIPTRETVLVLDYNYYCEIDNQGERSCLSGADIPIMVGGAQTYVASTPDNWKFRIGQENYEFFDISVKCRANCNASWEYCQHGCNFETGFCNHAPLTETNVTERYDINIYQPLPIIENSINRTQFAQTGLGFLLLFSTPIFLVTLIGILVGIISAYFTKESIVGVSSMIVLYTVFSLLQLYPI
jgi:hypothetical protein